MMNRLLLFIALLSFPLVSKADFGGLWKSSSLWLCPETMQVDTRNNLLAWPDRTGKNIMTPTIRKTSPNLAECPGNIPTVTPNVINGFGAMNLESTIALEGNELGVYRTVFMLAKPTTNDGVLFGLREDSDVTTHPYFAKTSSGMILHDGINSQSTSAPSSALALYGTVLGNPGYDILSVNGLNYASTSSKLKREIQSGYPMLGQRIYSFDRAYGRMTGQFVELVAFNQVLSERERWHVESYFAFKYGIALMGFQTSSPFTNTSYRRYVTSDLAIVWDGSASDLSSYYAQMNFVVRDDSAMLNIHYAKTRTSAGTIDYQVANGKQFSSPAPLLNNLSYAICGTNPVAATSGTYIKSRRNGVSFWCWDKQFTFKQQQVPVVSMQVNLLNEQMSLVDASVIGALCISATDTFYRKGIYNASLGVLTLDSLPLSDKTTVRLAFKALACIPIAGMNPGSVNPVMFGSSVNQQFRVINETDNYIYTVQSGTLPRGVSLSTDGLLTGVPEEKGNFPFVVRATSETGGCFFDKSYTLTVSCPTISVSLNASGTALEGHSCAEQLTAQGGTSPYQFSFISGVLPQALTMSPQGLITGQIAMGQGGDYSLVVQAMDSVGCTGQSDVLFQVGAFACINRVYASICEGEAYTYRGVRRTSAGVYVDTVRLSGGCDSMYILNLSVNPTYNKTIQASISSGGVYELNGKMYSVAGVYLDTLQTNFGCDSVFILQLEIGTTSATQRAYFGLQVYPNPATSHVLIQTKAIVQAITLELFNNKGVLVKREELSSGIPHQLFWDLQNIPAGIYFIRASAGNQVCVDKLVKY